MTSGSARCWAAISSRRAESLRRVAHDQQIQPLITNTSRATTSDEIERLLDVGIAEVEASHHQSW